MTLGKLKQFLFLLFRFDMRASGPGGGGSEGPSDARNSLAGLIPEFAELQLRCYPLFYLLI